MLEGFFLPPLNLNQSFSSSRVSKASCHISINEASTALTGGGCRAPAGHRPGNVAPILYQQYEYGCVSIFLSKMIQKICKVNLVFWGIKYCIFCHEIQNFSYLLFLQI
jgi:hypothetical protein